MRWAIGLIVICLHCVSVCYAQPEDFQGTVAADRWTVLHRLQRSSTAASSLPKSAKLVSLSDFQLTGPKPSHPFVLGNFASDGEWGLVKGYVQQISGKNAVMQFAWADQFELEGIAEHVKHGGWFILLGWNEGVGHGLINCNMIDSGSPWFLSRFRNSVAAPEDTVEFPKFNWEGRQPFRLTVQGNQLSLVIGKFTVFDAVALDGYEPGRIIFGTYETRYGTKPIRFESLRIRSLSNSEN